MDSNKNNDECNKVVLSSATTDMNLESIRNKDEGDSTHSSERGPISPNAYTLDFLHSVGVQISGVSNHVSIDALPGSSGERSISTGKVYPTNEYQK